MVVLDPVRCAYCGGCVSVCPVEALTLCETRLEIGDACFECGLCIHACPMGALRPGTPATGAVPDLHRRSYDVVVAGAGPGGSLAAETAARAGLRTLLLEKRQEIGSAVRCAEGVGGARLAEFLPADRRWIAAEITRAEVTTVTAGNTRTWRAEGGAGYILERRVFDRVLAERAARAGAEVRVKTAVTGILREAGRVAGVRVGRSDFAGAGGGGEIEIGARVVIAADGVEAQVGRWAGLGLQLPLADTMACAQYVLAGIDIDPACTSYFIGKEIAPGGYAWVFPKGEGVANVGLGVQADLTAPLRGPGEGEDGHQPALRYLDRFVESQPALARGYPVTLIAGHVPVALPAARMAIDGLMLVGDAARQVDPLTGGGIINAMEAGRLAGQVAAAAIVAADTGAGALARYQALWEEAVGRKMRRNYRLRGLFPPERRCDERFVQAFLFAAK